MDDDITEEIPANIKVIDNKIVNSVAKVLQGQGAPVASQKVDYEIDFLYLIGLTMTVGLSSMQFMMSLNGTCQIAPAIKYQ